MKVLSRSKRRLASPYQRPIAAIFFRVPPAYRSFHASPRPQFLDTAVSTTHAVFTSIHFLTDLPWVYSLPLTALAIRAVLVLPFSISQRRNLQKQTELAPVLGAWTQHYRKEAMKTVGKQGPTVATQYVLKRMLAKRNQLYARHDCNLWKNFLPLSNLPVWLLASETVRRMCGGGEGLLSTLFGHTELPGGGVQESFSTEGALWFPDLMMADPYTVLSYMMSLGMLATLWTPRRANQAIWKGRLKKASYVVAVAVWPLMSGAPAGLLVYWVSSVWLGFVQHALLDRFMPIMKPIVPCKTVPAAAVRNMAPRIPRRQVP